jgi:heme-degrading monooxygenase HmoA
MLNREELDRRYLVIWEFRIKPGMRERFESAYGPSGRWVRLFEQGEGYVRTELKRDFKNERVYTALDFWASREAYENFRRQHEAEYREIDAECEDLTECETQVGKFERVQP